MNLVVVSFIFSLYIKICFLCCGDVWVFFSDLSLPFPLEIFQFCSITCNLGDVLGIGNASIWQYSGFLVFSTPI